MKESFLDLLACPADGGSFLLRASEGDAGEVRSGTLECRGCGRQFPVVAGVPRILLDEMPAVVRRTGAAFGYEWKLHPTHHDYYREQFFDWVHPMEARDFEGRVVLDAGCGKGRHLDVISRCGARQAVGVDLSAAIDVAAAALADRPNVHLVQARLEQLPLRHAFDHVYSVGVIHHLADPPAAVRALRTILLPGGRMSLWLYGQEGNEWLLPWLLPLRRRLTTRLRFETLQAFSHLFSAPLWLALQAVYAPAARDPRWAGVRERLPYRPYFERLARFPYREVHHIVFDQLIAPLARYYTQDEARALAEQAGLTVQSVSRRNGNSWSVLARNGAVPPEAPRSS